MTGTGSTDGYVEVEVLLPADLAELVETEARTAGREVGEVVADIVRAFLDRLSDL